MWLLLAVVGIVPLVAAQGGLVINPKSANNGGTGAASVPIDISDLVNNRGFAMTPGDADFDGLHSGYPAHYLPPSNLTYSGVNFDFPQYKVSGDDNMLAQGQVLSPPAGRYIAVHMLAAAETAIASGYVNGTYSDNTTTSSAVMVDPFWDWPYPYGGDIVFPYYLTNSSIDYNRSMIFHSVSWLDSTKELTSLQLPNVTAGASNGPGGAAEDTRLHIFAVSLVPANGSNISLEVQYARSTQLWLEGTNKTQVFEITVSNVGTQWVLANNSVKVSVSGDGIQTVNPGIINRLRPSDQVIVQVGVVNTNGTVEGTNGTATVEIAGVGVHTTSTFNATFGIAPYDATFDSIYSHESPSWYSNSKYGIFIHWGVFSVPGWGNISPNESYAEWYWWDMNEGPDTTVQTYEYNLRTYGPNHTYDDFIPDFTASTFDPEAWVQLFADAGAQYFVQVTKHHDGFALFDTPATASNRNSVQLGPKRNLLQELFDAAAQYQPQLHRGTYFSLPEWFNPSYAPYGFGEWPGGAALNPYTNQTLPYTGYVPVSDFISDVILPEMLLLSSMGSEILWCDIGGPNLTAEFAATYFNNASLQGRQVTIDNRCGLPGDFDTPEYAKYASVQPRKWESSLGMDPFSYGYNRATPDSAYITPQGIVTTLMDIISKNGNFLLDIGPQANGTIIEIEQQNLRQAGTWIHDHAEAIFNTTYWFVTPEEGDYIRFTQNADAFYITSLARPNGSIVLSSPMPWVEGDDVVVVGGNSSGTVVPSALDGMGRLVIGVSEEVAEADRWSWVFRIGFGGVVVQSGNGTGNGTGVVPVQNAAAELGRGLSLGVVVGLLGVWAGMMLLA